MHHCMSERVRQITSAMVRFQVLFNVIQVSSALTVILFSSALNAISCYNMLLLDKVEGCHGRCVFGHKCLMQCHI